MRFILLGIILLGAPGAGKGTQAEAISKYLSIPTISTGNIIRAALKSGTEVGKMAKSFTDKGELVPDEIVIEIIKDRLNCDDCKNGFILDGFPRTIPQAEALDKMGISIHKVIDIEVSDDEIVNRMSGRRICTDCGSSYNLMYKKSIIDGVCDKCSGTLVQREDDQPRTVLNRLKVYHDQTEPLKDYYKNQGKLVIVDGQKDLDEVTRQILDKIEAQE